MPERGHDSPESAAMEGFPTAHCRVIASRTFEDDAHVLLDTGSPGQPYLYGSTASGSKLAQVTDPAGGRPTTIPISARSRFGVTHRPELISCASSSTAPAARHEFSMVPTF
jgi:hypothetical protein